MNKKCPICNKKVTSKDDHIFYEGKRCHKKCLPSPYTQIKIRERKK